MTEMMTPLIDVGLNAASPRRKQILFFLDIDGFCVRGFDMKGRNPAQNADQIRKQPPNRHIMNQFRQWYNQTKADIRVVIATGRKELLKAITLVQLSDLWFLIDKIYYYPDQFHYDPPTEYHTWKIGLFGEEIMATKPDEIIVGDDDIPLLIQCDAFFTEYFNEIPRSYWIAIKDQYLITTSTIMDLGEPSEVDG